MPSPDPFDPFFTMDEPRSWGRLGHLDPSTVDRECRRSSPVLRNMANGVRDLSRKPNESRDQYDTRYRTWGSPCRSMSLKHDVVGTFNESHIQGHARRSRSSPDYLTEIDKVRSHLRGPTVGSPRCTEPQPSRNFRPLPTQKDPLKPWPLEPLSP